MAEVIKFRSLILGVIIIIEDGINELNQETRERMWNFMSPAAQGVCRTQETGKKLFAGSLHGL